MIDDDLDRRVAVLAAVGPQEAHREIHADHAAGFADRRQLPVGEIARMRAQGVGVGMRGDKGRVAQFGHVPEAALIEMREVDQDFQPVAGADQFLAEIGQARPGVGRRRTAERHAVPERVGPAPHRTERAQPAWCNTSRVSNSGSIASAPSIWRTAANAPASHAMADVLDRAADAEPSVGLAFDADQDGCHARYGGLCGREVERRRQGRARRGVERGRCLLARARSSLGAIWARARRSRTGRRQIRPERPSADPAVPCLRRRERRAARPRPCA